MRNVFFGKKLLLSFILCGLLTSPAFSQSTPEETYLKMVEAMAKKDLQTLNALHFDPEGKDKIPENEEEKKALLEFVYMMRPIRPKILKKEMKENGEKAVLWVEAMRNDFLGALFNPKKKSKLAKETSIVLLVQDQEVWKVYKECTGNSINTVEKCEDKPKTVDGNFGKAVSITDRVSLEARLLKKPILTSVKAEGKPLTVALLFKTQQEENLSSAYLHYSFHASPQFSDFNVLLDGKTYTPKAVAKDVTEKSGKFLVNEKETVLEAGVSYSWSQPLNDGAFPLIFLFDLPKESGKSKKIFEATFTLNDQKYKVTFNE